MTKKRQQTTPTKSAALPRRNKTGKRPITQERRSQSIRASVRTRRKLNVLDSSEAHIPIMNPAGERQTSKAKGVRNQSKAPLTKSEGKNPVRNKGKNKVK